MTAADKAGEWYQQLKGLRAAVEGAARDEAQAGEGFAAAGELHLELADVELADVERATASLRGGAGRRCQGKCRRGYAGRRTPGRG